jgi:hypothetical protein
MATVWVAEAGSVKVRLVGVATGVGEPADGLTSTSALNELKVEALHTSV